MAGEESLIQAVTEAALPLTGTALDFTPLLDLIGDASCAWERGEVPETFPGAM
jgi:hypothetical protein